MKFDSTYDCLGMYISLHGFMSIVIYFYSMNTEAARKLEAHWLFNALEHFLQKILSENSF
jgi:hypothetical protein